MDYFPNPFIIPVGIAIGILVAAPVGPVNVLCIQRALQRGFWGGVAAGAGAVLGDGLIALSASMGVGAISGAVKHYRASIQIVGGIALIAFGVHLYMAAPRVLEGGPDDAATPALSDYLWDVSKSFLLTVTNPGAVLGLVAIFGGIGTFVELRGSVDALVLVGAIVAGSLAWWMFLSATVSWVKDRLALGNLARINRIAGIFLVGFGLVLVGEIGLLMGRLALAGH